MSAAAGNAPANPGSASPSTVTAPNRRILDTLPTGARLTGAQAAARSIMIRRLRVALPILACVLIAAFLMNTQNSGVDEAFLEDFKDIEAKPENLSMGNPRFTGIDTRGNPFDITAFEATRDASKQDFVTLDHPKAITGGDGKQSVVFADKGGYATDTRILQLEENVMLDHNIGGEKYVLKTPAATVTVDEQLVISDAGITGRGPRGESLTADRMNAFNNEGRVVFEGNVRMRIYPSKEGIDDKAPELREGPPAPFGEAE